MQIDYPRWPPGTVTKNSINTKMTISQDPLVEIEPALCQNVSFYESVIFFFFFFFAVWDFKMAAVTKKAQNMKMTISQ